MRQPAVLAMADPVHSPRLEAARRRPRETEEQRWFLDEILPHEPMLRAWLAGRYDLAGELDDIVQESYLRVLRARSRGPIFAGKAFLFTTARNLAISRFRRHPAPAEPVDPATLADERPAAPQQLAHQQELTLLAQAIEALPERCRAVFTLRKLEGLSQREIARHLGVAEHTVEAHVRLGTRRCISFFAACAELDLPASRPAGEPALRAAS